MRFNNKGILRLLGKAFTAFGIIMVLPLLAAVVFHETHVLLSLAFPSFLSLFTGILLLAATPKSVPHLRIRDGFLFITALWISLSFMGGLPFLLSGSLNFIDSFFEGVAAFTTTGTTLTSHIPLSLVFLRALLSFTGGLLIILFGSVFLPQLKIGGQHILHLSATGSVSEKTATSIKDQGHVFISIYMLFTFFEALLLKFQGLSWFNCLVCSMGTVSTGGINFQEGFLVLPNNFSKVIIPIFMVLSSLNYTLYFSTLRAGIKSFFQDEEIRFYLSLILLSAVFTGLVLYCRGLYSLKEAFLHSFFFAASFSSTTGYFLEEYSLWPTFAAFLLLILMLIGASSGSPGGGMKAVRILVVMRFIRRGLITRLHPNAVCTVRLSDKTLLSDVVTSVTSFCLLFMAFVFFGSLVYSVSGYNLVSSLNLSVAFLSNTGAGYMHFPPLPSFLKLFSALMMIAGRLELFAFLLLMSPRFYRGL